MIVGVYQDSAPRIILRTVGNADEAEIEYVVDTAFHGGVSLPLNWIQRLGASPNGSDLRVLADGSLSRCNLYEIEVDWDGEMRVVELILLDTRPLLGTDLINGCHLDIEAIEGGEVLIEPLN